MFLAWNPNHPSQGSLSMRDVRAFWSSIVITQLVTDNHRVNRETFHILSSAQSNM